MSENIFGLERAEQAAYGTVGLVIGFGTAYFGGEAFEVKHCITSVSIPAESSIRQCSPLIKTAENFADMGIIVTAAFGFVALGAALKRLGQKVESRYH